MRTLLVLVTLLAAGCTAPAAVEAPTPVTPDPSTLTYGDCDELLGAFPVDPDAVELPEGFAPAPFMSESAATIFLVGWSCAAGADDAGRNEGAPFVEAFAGFGVEPPEAWRLDGAFAHAILLGLTTTSTVGAMAYEAWSVPAADGTVTFEWQEGPSGGVGTLAGAAGPLDVAMRVAAGAPGGEVADEVRFFAVTDGLVTGAYDIAWTAATGFQGTASSTAALPGAPPATGGLGFYYTSDDPTRYTMTRVHLPVLGDA